MRFLTRISGMAKRRGPPVSRRAARSGRRSTAPCSPTPRSPCDGRPHHPGRRHDRRAARQEVEDRRAHAGGAGQGDPSQWRGQLLLPEEEGGRYMMTTKARRRYVSPPVVARWLEVQEKTVTNWIREGVEIESDGEVVRLRLPALNVGGL